MISNSHYGVLIIGAGLSGIGAACHLKRHCPDIRYGIIEQRSRIGGTWDIFKYPGIRSDSDMYTLGYNFRPWTDTKMLADGPSIRQYIDDAATENDVNKNILFEKKISQINWSSANSCWSVTIIDQVDGTESILTCDFVFSCTGYYRYDKGYTPKFTNVEKFGGDIIHPQNWPDNYDYKDKRVVVIGSGATAVTLVPAMADKTAHITMLQRSPTYVASVPERDLVSEKLRKVMPEILVYRLARARNILLQRSVYELSMKKPLVVKKLLLAATKKQLGPDVDIAHFEPNYNPWEERLCAVPKGDLFKVLREGKASVVTDQIDTFTGEGIQLKSGKHLDADIIITATGLDLQLVGGADIIVDNKKLNIADEMMYKGLMMEGVPNFALMFGYTNSSWTLKSDIASEFVCRLLNHMHRIHAEKVVPVDTEHNISDFNFLNLRSGYVRRADSQLPRQGKKSPWKNLDNYLQDRSSLRDGDLNDGFLIFYRNGKRLIKSENRKLSKRIRSIIPM